MTILEIIPVLSQAASGANAAAQVLKYARELLSRPTPPDVAATIARLPAGATAEQIVSALSGLPSVGGRLSVKAGDDGGGNTYIQGAYMSGGDGRHQGGDAVFAAGDGGPNGKGGDLVIGPGVYKGGDAKG